MHHAFVIEAEAEEGVMRAQAWLARELGMVAGGNPDVIVREYSLLSVADARGVNDIAAQAPFTGEYKALIIAASRVYHEAQNALLKLFEEPPQGTYLFLIVPNAGALLPTLRSRVQVLKKHEARSTKHEINPAEAFLTASKEKRSALIKKLATGRDEEERRENRDKALAIVNGVEQAAYKYGLTKSIDLLNEIQLLRGYLHDRSAPIRMILEHISLVLPSSLQQTANSKQ